MRVIRSRTAVRMAMLGLVLVPALMMTNEPRAAAPPGPYALTDLGTLGGLSAQAYDLNNAGQVVGYATNSSSQSRAFLWQSGQMSDLGVLGGSASVAQAINATGQVVGYSAVVTASQAYRAVMWDGASKINLTPDLAASDTSTATGINSARQVVGTINYSIAFRWDNGNVTILPHLGGGGGHAADINDAGQIVGTSSSAHVTPLGPMGHAALWENDTVTDLGLLPGDEDSGAAAINSLGHIVGSSGRTDPDTYETSYRAFIYKDGVMTALPVPSVDSYGGDINDSGVVVGTMRAGGGASKWHAWVYADGVAANLNSLIPTGTGLHLAYANAVNSAGQITGVAVDGTGRYHAYLLTPVAPGTSVLSAGDGSVTEGHAGTRAVSFTVSLSPASSAPVSVAYTTGNGSAQSGVDYTPVSGTLTFAAGQTSATVTADVIGDRTGEPNETFMLNLGQSQGAVVADGQGTATIVDDEPRVTITDLSKSEGHSGTTPFAFTVRLSAASGGVVTVNYATAAGSARSPEDFDAKSGSLTFLAGEIAKTVTVSVKADRTREWDEVFYVNLSGAAGAFVSDTQGTAVVRNDDR